MSYDEFMVTYTDELWWVYGNLHRWVMMSLSYTDELCSPDFKLCVQAAISALSTKVDKSMDIIVRALYGAAACMIKTAGHKKKRLHNWFTKSARKWKKSVKRQLRKFRRTNNHGEREKYVKYRKEYKLLWMKKKKKMIKTIETKF